MQELPYQLGNGKFKNRNRWSSRAGSYHKTNGEYPWTIVERIIENNIGKSFDKAFRFYCKQVPSYQQDFFLKEFDDALGWNGSRNDYYADENGLIQRHKAKDNYKGPFRFESIDAVWESRHKITGKKKPEYTWGIKNFKDSDYESVLIKGWIKYFDSKYDPEYKRLKAEKQKVKNREYYKRYHNPKLSNEEFRKILKAKELKERQEDLIKIESHGFDILTSFRK